VQQQLVVVHYNSMVEVELANFRIPGWNLSTEQEEGERNWQEEVVRSLELRVFHREVLHIQDRLVYRREVDMVDTHSLEEVHSQGWLITIH